MQYKSPEQSDSGDIIYSGMQPQETAYCRPRNQLIIVGDTRPRAMAVVKGESVPLVERQKMSMYLGVLPIPY